MKTPSFVTLPGPLQHYTIHTKEATRAALSEARQQLTKKGKDAILRRHGLHDMEPGSFMDGPGAILLLDQPYRLTTPDLLHLLLRYPFLGSPLPTIAVKIHLLVPSVGMP